MIAERFQPEHLREIDLQPEQLPALKAFESAEYVSRIASGVAGTLRDDSGRIVAIGGVADFEDGSLLWAFLAKDCRQHMVSVVRAAQRMVQVAKRPVLATAACDFEPGCRLLAMLGFQRWPDELRGVAADGKAHYVFERAA